MKQLILLFIASVLIVSCTNEEISRAKSYWNENIKNSIVSPFSSPVCANRVCIE